MKVGARVRYICKDRWAKEYAGYYPPVGTLGTVEDTDNSKNIFVQWDSGTKGNGRWWCSLDEVEVVEGEEPTKKEFTAKKARETASKSRLVDRETKRLLRDIKRAAKKGKYALRVSYRDWNDVAAEKICENLKGLGYVAFTDIWRAAIYISWKGEE